MTSMISVPRLTQGLLAGLLAAAVAWPAGALGLDDCLPLTSDAAQTSLATHLYGGSPDGEDPIARRGYVFSYGSGELVPAWAAWHAAPEYRDAPPRKGIWKTFRQDARFPDVVSDDYVGWFDSEFNYARGHIVPYFISGGDRDRNGRKAVVPGTLAIDDEEDACTVFEINAMSNISPQFHDRFNGRGGVWFTLETDVRNMLDRGASFHIIAGTVFAEGTVTHIGDRDEPPASWRIGVPHGFFKIVIDDQNLSAVGFLFDHTSDLEHGCNIDQVEWPSECIVPMEEIEALTGLGFFPNMTDAENQFLRSASVKETWFRWLGIGE